MNVRPEPAASRRSVVEEGVLPYAPMAMPEQVLERQRMTRPLRIPFLGWLVWK